MTAGAVPAFVRQAGDLLWNWTPVSVGLPSYRIAFLPVAADAPDRISLTDAWQAYPGICLFLGAVPSNQARFAVNLAAYCGGRPVRFLWVANPDDAPNLWQGGELAVSTDGSVALPAAIPFGSFRLGIGKGSQVALAGDGTGFTVTQPAGGGALFLRDQSSGRTLLASGAAAGISFAADATAGCLSLPLLVKGGDDPDLAALQVGCCYFVNDSEQPGYVTPLHYQLFTPGSGDVTVYATLDPVNPLSAARTYLGLVPPGMATGPALTSTLRTNLGQAATLTPLATSAQSAKLVFGVVAGTPEPAGGDPFYLMPDGPFGCTVAGGPAMSHLILGSSGAEYVGLPATGSQLLFVSGQNAYAPGVASDPSLTPPVTDPGLPLPPLLAGGPTTAWAYPLLQAGGAVGYYSQPDESLLYTHDIQDTAGFLSFMELAGGDLPGVPSAFPLVPHAGIDPALAELSQRFEQQAASPARRAIIQKLAANANAPLPEWQPAPVQAIGPLVPSPGDQTGVTPQGLLSTFNQSRSVWRALTLAQSSANAEILQFTAITGKFREALLTNQLFAVISNPDAFLDAASVNFMLTAEALFELAHSQNPPPAAMLAQITAAMQGQFYPDRAGYVAALNTWTAGGYAPYLDGLLHYGAYSKMTIEGWSFDLSPYRWREHNTLLIFKFNGSSLEEMAADPGRWAWPESAQLNGSLLPTRDRLGQIIRDAKARAATEPDLAHFVEIAADPGWNGVLYLNVPLNPAELPPDLRGLAAGLDPARFYAHHFGLNSTPVTVAGSNLQLGDTSLFGLIDYNDRTDLFDNGSAYQFKVLTLKVLFVNSVIAQFTSQVELLVAELFGEGATVRDGQHGNNLIFNGSLQKQNGHDTYLYTQVGNTRFNMNSRALAEVETARAQFVTLQQPAGASPDAMVQTEFRLWGAMRFQSLSTVDLFSFDALAFGGMVVGMEFSPADPLDRRFRFSAADLALDLASSVSRPGSLYSHFPLKLKGLMQAQPDTTPEGLGYISVHASQSQAQLKHPWFGLQFELQLGALGALAGSAGLVATLLVAWAPAGQERVATYLGLKLPGSSSASPEIPIEGVLTLGFKRIELKSRGSSYMLKFRNFGLRLFSLSFPPGQADVYLFGDPSQTAPNPGGTSPLGWYAAYMKKKPQ